MSANEPLPCGPRYKTNGRIQRWVSGWTVPCLLLCGACAAPTPQYVRVETCSVPTARLSPTPEPDFNDATNGALLSEIEGPDEWRSSLRACNRDKADTKRLIEHVQQQPKGERK